MNKPVIVDEVGKLVGIVRGVDVFDPTFDPTFSGDGGPYYLYGHRREIASVLSEMDQSEEFKFKKYPLFAFRLPTPEKVSGGFVEYDLNIAILYYTDPNDRAPGRYDKVIKPMLYPLYEQFMDAIKYGGLGWHWEGDHDMPPHTVLDRPFYGVEELGIGKEGSDSYPFNDPLDAIEIVNLRMKKELVCTI